MYFSSTNLLLEQWVHYFLFVALPRWSCFMTSHATKPFFSFSFLSPSFIFLLLSIPTHPPSLPLLSSLPLSPFQNFSLLPVLWDLLKARKGCKETLLPKPENQGNPIECLHPISSVITSILRMSAAWPRDQLAAHWALWPARTESVPWEASSGGWDFKMIQLKLSYLKEEPDAEFACRNLSSTIS